MWSLHTPELSAPDVNTDSITASNHFPALRHPRPPFPPRSCHGIHHSVSSSLHPGRSDSTWLQPASPHRFLPASADIWRRILKNITSLSGICLYIKQTARAINNSTCFCLTCPKKGLCYEWDKFMHKKNIQVTYYVKAYFTQMKFLLSLTYCDTSASSAQHGKFWGMLRLLFLQEWGCRALTFNPTFFVPHTKTSHWFRTTQTCVNGNRISVNQPFKSLFWVHHNTVYNYKGSIYRILNHPSALWKVFTVMHSWQKQSRYHD